MANPIFGSLVQDDTLQSILVATGGSMLQFDIESLTLFVESLYAAHTKLLAEHLSVFGVAFTSKRLKNYRGNNNNGEFEKLGEFGRPAFQQNTYTDQLMGFPCENFGRGVAWTREAFRTMKPEQFRAEQASILNNDTRVLINALQTAIFTPTNYTFIDSRTDKMSLPVKAFANGDSFFYPTGAQGQSFTSHNHYLGRIGGSFAAADMDAAQNTLLEHYPNARLRHLIGRGSVSTFTGGGVTGFSKYETVNVRVSTTDRYAETKRTSYADSYQDWRDIGEYNGAVVTAVWWMPTNYMVTIIESNDLEEAPLWFRIISEDENYMGSTLPSLYLPTGGTDEAGPGSLRVIKETDTILNATRVEREFGIAPNNRLGIAITKMDNGTYSAPSSFGVGA